MWYPCRTIATLVRSTYQSCSLADFRKSWEPVQRLNSIFKEFNIELGIQSHYLSQVACVEKFKTTCQTHGLSEDQTQFLLSMAQVSLFNLNENDNTPEPNDKRIEKWHNVVSTLLSTVWLSIPSRLEILGDFVVVSWMHNAELPATRANNLKMLTNVAQYPSITKNNTRQLSRKLETLGCEPSKHSHYGLIAQDIALSIIPWAIIARYCKNYIAAGMINFTDTTTAVNAVNAGPFGSYIIRLSTSLPGQIAITKHALNGQVRHARSEIQEIQISILKRSIAISYLSKNIIYSLFTAILPFCPRSHRGVVLKPLYADPYGFTTIKNVDRDPNVAIQHTHIQAMNTNASIQSYVPSHNKEHLELQNPVPVETQITYSTVRDVRLLLDDFNKKSDVLILDTMPAWKVVRIGHVWQDALWSIQLLLLAFNQHMLPELTTLLTHIRDTLWNIYQLFFAIVKNENDSAGENKKQLMDQAKTLITDFLHNDLTTDQRQRMNSLISTITIQEDESSQKDTSPTASPILLNISNAIKSLALHLWAKHGEHYGPKCDAHTIFSTTWSISALTAFDPDRYTDNAPKILEKLIKHRNADWTSPCDDRCFSVMKMQDLCQPDKNNSTEQTSVSIETKEQQLQLLRADLLKKISRLLQECEEVGTIFLQCDKQNTLIIESNMFPPSKKHKKNSSLTETTAMETDNTTTPNQKL